MRMVAEKRSRDATPFMTLEPREFPHLFQGRYKALLVDGDSYLLELTRYIHLNPVHARLVKKLKDFRWSSTQAVIGNLLLPLGRKWEDFLAKVDDF